MKQMMAGIDAVRKLLPGFITVLCLVSFCGCSSDDDDDFEAGHLVTIADNNLPVARSNGDVNNYIYGEGETAFVDILPNGKTKACFCQHLAFRSAQALLASAGFSARYPNGIPMSDIRIVTKWNTDGAEELFVDHLGWAGADVKTRKDATDRSSLTLEDAVFYYVLNGSDTAWRVSAQAGLFPPDFFRLRTAARTGNAEDKAAFQAVRTDAIENHLTPLPLKNGFKVEEVSVASEGLEASLTTDYGYLVIAHGHDAAWNMAVTDSLAPLTALKERRYALCFLEDPMETAGDTFIPTQKGYDALVSRGADEIIVVPLFVSSHSNHIDEVKFVTNLGSLDDPEAALLENMISESSAPVVGMTKSVDAHPAIGRGLASQILAAGDAPDLDNYIVLLSHGAVGDEEDVYWQDDLDNILAEIKANLPENFAADTRVITLRVHDYPRYDEKMAELREILNTFLNLGEVFLVYNHVQQGYLDTTVVEGIGRPPFPGALGELSSEQLARLHQVRHGYVDLGIIPGIVQARVDEYHNQ